MLRGEQGAQAEGTDPNLGGMQERMKNAYLDAGGHEQDVNDAVSSLLLPPGDPPVSWWQSPW